MLLGCATNCLPAALPIRFALVVAAYSAGLSDCIAFAGKYRSPVWDEGLPDLVCHFWLPQSFKDFCGAFIQSLQQLILPLQELALLKLLLFHKCMAHLHLKHNLQHDL